MENDVGGGIRGRGEGMEDDVDGGTGGMRGTKGGYMSARLPLI